MADAQQPGLWGPQDSLDEQDVFDLMADMAADGMLFPVARFLEMVEEHDGDLRTEEEWRDVASRMFAEVVPHPEEMDVVFVSNDELTARDISRAAVRAFTAITRNLQA